MQKKFFSVKILKGSLMLHKIAFFFASILLISCNKGEKQFIDQKKYIDVRKIFVDQIEILRKGNQKITKKITIDSTVETLNLAKVEWEKELEAFLKLDINKPAYINSFISKETAEGLTYSISEGEKSAIKEIKLKRSNVTHGMTEISAIISDDNMLFSWQKNIVAYFENQKMTGYKIFGKQKMVFLDEKIFEIEGKIIPN